jgi:4,5-DOPA dioxygenase extradiol
MKLNELDSYTRTLSNTDVMPVLFLGHGSPMNAIEENPFVDGFRAVARTLPKPAAIVCISAHWETRGTFVTAMEMPRTIHDFGGFPQALFNVEYPAPGSPALAAEMKETLATASVELDSHWGLDHGAWSVIKHLYPDADVPVLQLSIDYTKSPLYHYELARQLAWLRKKGVLIIGSGNMVHNLGLVAWNKLGEDNYGYDWALEARQKINSSILSGDHRPLLAYTSQGQALRLAVPTPEHFIPLLYSLGLQKDGESVSLFNDKAIGGSLTMTSLKIG